MTQLSNDERILSELYAIKIAVLCLIKAVFDKSSDRQAAATNLLDLASNSIEFFEIRGADANCTERFRGAMHVRVQEMVSSALNPGILQRGRS
jgi:hypothetical protein